MKLTLLEISQLNHEINGLARGKEVIMKGMMLQKTSLKVKVYMQRLNKAIADDVKTYEDEKLKIFKKYGEEKDGMITVKPADIEAFNKELKELQDTEVEVQVQNLWSTDLTVENLSDINSDEFYPILFKIIDNETK